VRRVTSASSGSSRGDLRPQGRPPHLHPASSSGATSVYSWRRPLPRRRISLPLLRRQNVLPRVGLDLRGSQREGSSWTTATCLCPALGRGYGGSSSLPRFGCAAAAMEADEAQGARAVAAPLGCFGRHREPTTAGGCGRDVHNAVTRTIDFF
jgi:hypothetical protein